MTPANNGILSATDPRSADLRSPDHAAALMIARPPKARNGARSVQGRVWYPVTHAPVCFTTVLSSGFEAPAASWTLVTK